MRRNSGPISFSSPDGLECARGISYNIAVFASQRGHTYLGTICNPIGYEYLSLNEARVIRCECRRSDFDKLNSASQLGAGKLAKYVFYVRDSTTCPICREYKPQGSKYYLTQDHEAVNTKLPATSSMLR